MKLELKYGLNPNQKRASVEVDGEPLKVLNGRPGYINLLDAFNAYQAVMELDEALSSPSAASFKHVSPAGLSIGNELSEKERKGFFVPKSLELSSMASAYVRARSSDRMSSFGDFIALSRECDKSVASFIEKEVSDGIIAPSYSPEALEILKRKKNGSYVILELDPYYSPLGEDMRKVYGFTFREDRNTLKINKSTFSNIVTGKTLDEKALIDLTVATVAIKYTQSNSVSYAYNGQAISIGAGQQSRLHATRLAGDKADRFTLRLSDKVLSLPFIKGLSRNQKDNIIEQYLAEDPEEDVVKNWQNYFTKKVEPFTKEEKKEYLLNNRGRSLSSDAFFPFSDNIVRAYKSGVDYIAEPGGSTRDNDIIEKCKELGIVLTFTNQRLFHH